MNDFGYMSISKESMLQDTYFMESRAVSSFLGERCIKICVHVYSYVFNQSSMSFILFLSLFNVTFFMLCFLCSSHPRFTKLAVSGNTFPFAPSVLAAVLGELEHQERYWDFWR